MDMMSVALVLWPAARPALAPPAQFWPAKRHASTKMNPGKLLNPHENTSPSTTFDVVVKSGDRPNPKLTSRAVLVVAVELVT